MASLVCVPTRESDDGVARLCTGAYALGELSRKTNLGKCLARELVFGVWCLPGAQARMPMSRRPAPVSVPAAHHPVSSIEAVSNVSTNTTSLWGRRLAWRKVSPV
jgi:hypothetical protein